MKRLTLHLLLLGFGICSGQNHQNNPGSNHGSKFEPLGTILPTANMYRAASGAPGHAYWQQRADYNISAYLDENKKNLKGTATITYHNNSPDNLEYLWLQLDENQHSNINNAGYDKQEKIASSYSIKELNSTKLPKQDNGYGVHIETVKSISGKDLPYFINKTMMRVDLPQPLRSKDKITFTVKWNYNLVNRTDMGGRGGYEYFPEEDNHIFTITQWFPRMCVYSDFRGWQHNQFSGRGEFALNFGDYHVEINVPADHVVAATGECQNYPQVLSPVQLERWKKAQTAKEPIEIITLLEAQKAEKSKSKARKTWIFNAQNVRDFAWTSSRKYIWDAMAITLKENNKKVMCMSQYPKEAYHLYRKFSTKAVAHTIKTYSDFTLPYPYPVAQSVEASNGMEYPMICFNYGRTEKDGTYSEATKNGMIGVIIHEVGHNFFPMIINSDERQWSWMDEGLNTFLEYLTEELWDNKFPSRRGPAHTIVDYMKLPKDQLEPIMTNSENIAHFGPNSYSKPATALNILRETIMGRELFDKALKTYARRWAFKHPEPADFFRTMNDASAENLDWFWRGWFYGTDPVDIAINRVTVGTPDMSPLPRYSSEKQKKYKLDQPLVHEFEDISKKRNREDPNIKFLTEEDPQLQDFYYHYARGRETVNTEKEYPVEPDVFEPISKLEAQKLKNKTLYQIDFKNIGGLVMPIILEFTFEDGTKLYDKKSAQIWRYNELEVSLTYIFDKKLRSIQLDPMKETADIDTDNNFWGSTYRAAQSKFQIFKEKQKNKERGAATGRVNPMQVAQTKG